MGTYNDIYIDIDIDIEIDKYIFLFIKLNYFFFVKIELFYIMNKLLIKLIILSKMSYNYIYIDNSYLNDDNKIINIDDNVCRCNKKNTKLDEMILFFCYLYTDCHNCAISYEDDDIERYEYTYGYIVDFRMYKNDTYEKIKKCIKDNPDLIFKKNYIGFYPLKFINVLQDILEKRYDYKTTIEKDKKLIIENISYLDKIKENIKEQGIKKEAFEYITKTTTLIGNQFGHQTLPYELWEYIFTFI